MTQTAEILDFDRYTSSLAVFTDEQRALLEKAVHTICTTPVIYDCDDGRVEMLSEALPDLIKEAEQDLAPGDPQAVHNAMLGLIERLNLSQTPSEASYQMDLEIMSKWPKDLFAQALYGIWENFTYRRLPVVGEFKTYIADDLQKRKDRLARYRLVERKLSAPGLRARQKSKSEQTANAAPEEKQNRFEVLLANSLLSRDILSVKYLRSHLKIARIEKLIELIRSEGRGRGIEADEIEQLVTLVQEKSE